jgi:hypothetical protein
MSKLHLQGVRKPVNISRFDWVIKKINRPLFSPLENKNSDSRDKSGYESITRKTRCQERTLKGGQIPLLSPQVSHLETRILDR